MIEVEIDKCYKRYDGLFLVLDIKGPTTGPALMKSLGTSLPGFPTRYSVVVLHKRKGKWYRDYKYDSIHEWADEEITKEVFLKKFKTSRYTRPVAGGALLVQRLDDGKVTDELLEAIGLNI